jgi:predicted unusual protein kinase regulating ubiquinone biosynthesis (AarF/ABC1/UbiB family)
LFSQAIKEAGIDVEGFLTVGVSAALRQLLEFGLFHGDPHPGNIFAMRDGRIAYVDFGNVAVLSQVWNIFCLTEAEFIFPLAINWILIIACLSIYD